MPAASDQQVRLAAFDWLSEQTDLHGDVLPWKLLLGGFTFKGERVSLVSMQGIFTPKVCRLPLTIRTSPGGPYADAFSANGLLLYRYRGTDPFHRDNVGLRDAKAERQPLVYLHGRQRPPTSRSNSGREYENWTTPFILRRLPCGQARSVRSLIFPSFRGTKSVILERMKSSTRKSGQIRTIQMSSMS